MLPDFTSTHRGRPWHHAGHRILYPFQDAAREEWCRSCQLATRPAQEVRFEGRVYAYKRWCRRCGTVTSHGVYNQEFNAALGARALAWATSPEEA